MEIKRNDKIQIEEPTKLAINLAIANLRESSYLYYGGGLVEDEVNVKMDNLTSLCKIDNGFLMPEKDKIIAYTY